MGQGQASGVGAQQLEERYFLQKVKLGQGSFGTVWRAVDRQSGSTVAIKQLDKASLPRRGVTRQDIEREISMMKAVSHENVTQLFDHFEDATSIYLALEYCDGGDFGDKVKEKGMGVEEPEVAEWCRQMCASIQAMHAKGICHRDVKPDNFMVAGNSTLKLSDFGLAIYLPRGKLLQEKCGTPAFMAPEQHYLPKRSPGYSFPVDIWAAGVAMFMMMFGGRHPFLNDRGHLDEALLLGGELDFRDGTGYNGFFGFGARPLRFSEEARRLCKSMVEPDPERRVSAEQATASPWLNLGLEHGHGPKGVSPRPSVSPPKRPAQGAAGAAPAHPGARSTTPRGRAVPLDGVPEGRGASSPDGRSPRAAQEAERLKQQNQSLQAELEDRRRREEQLVQEQTRLKVQQQRLQQQRTKELQMQNEKLIEQEKQLQRVEQEKLELELQRNRDTETAPIERSIRRGSTVPMGQRGRGPATPSGGQLRSGLRCRYESGTYGWMEAVVQGYNESDGTYNLDVRQHAALDKISPTATVSAAEAWPPGTLTAYHSATVNQWLPAVVVSFNETDSTYNLDVRDHADLDRIRARAGDKPAEEQQPQGRASSANGRAGAYNTEMAGDGRRAPELRRGQTVEVGGPRGTAAQGRDGSSRAPLRVGDLETAGGAAMTTSGAGSGRRVGVGDRVALVEGGLAIVEAVHEGAYSVRTPDRQRLKLQAEVLRAPGEARFAWPAGTKVFYQSASLKGRWIDANVVSFNADSGTYNLDVRMEATVDRVRPR